MQNHPQEKAEQKEAPKKVHEDAGREQMIEMTVEEAKALLLDAERVKEEANSMERMTMKERPLEKAIDLVKDDQAFLKQLIQFYIDNVDDNNSLATVLYHAVIEAKFEDNDLFIAAFNKRNHDQHPPTQIVWEMALAKITDRSFLRKYADIPNEDTDYKNDLGKGDWNRKYQNSLFKKAAQKRMEELGGK